MTKNTKALIFSGFVLSIAFAASYFNFAEYKPKSIRQIEDVKGLHTSRGDTSSIALPEGAEKIGVNKSTDSEQTTFHTNKSKQEIQAFYKNIFVSNKWSLESQGTYDDFIVSRYNKDHQTVSVITLDTKDDFKTLVSLESSNL
jgi:hypothetical protein